MNQTCETCRYWDGPIESDIEGQTMGMCRRYPPIGGEGAIGQFPLTYSINWCGEWLTKAEDHNQRKRVMLDLAAGSRPDGMSVRAGNVFRRAVHDHTAEIVATWGIEEWKVVRNCGQVTAIEIMEWLNQTGDK